MVRLTVESRRFIPVPHLTTMQASRAGPHTLRSTICSPDRETCLFHTAGNPPILFKLVTRQQLSTGNNFWSLPTHAV